MKKRQIATTLLTAAILLAGCQTAEGNEKTHAEQESKAVESVQASDRTYKSIGSSTAVPIDLDGAMASVNGRFYATRASDTIGKQLKGNGLSASVSAEIKKAEEKETESEKAESSAEETVATSEAKPSNGEEATVKADQSANTPATQPKKQATQEAKKESQPVEQKKTETPAPKAEVKAPVQESKPEPKPTPKPAPAPAPKPEPAPEPEYEYTPRKVASSSATSALAQSLRGATPHNVKVIPSSPGDYWADYGDVIVQAGWDTAWWGADAITRDQGHDAYGRLTQYLNSNGFSNHGSAHGDYDSFINASGKRYRATLSDMSKEFEIHIILQ